MVFNLILTVIIDSDSFHFVTKEVTDAFRTNHLQLIKFLRTKLAKRGYLKNHNYTISVTVGLLCANLNLYNEKPTSLGIPVGSCIS